MIPRKNSIILPLIIIFHFRNLQNPQNPHMILAVHLRIIMRDCNLRRTAATGAFASGHPAEPNGHLH